jgi:CubicO group peptidase (beta-lactamase class C family)
MQKRRIPGLALAVVKNGVVVKTHGYGIANLETDTPVTPETVFELASITKQFTAAAIMLLVEDVRVGLDDRISKYLDDTPSAWEKITVRHLLTHTSGLPTIGNDFKGLVWTFRVSTADMYAAARRDPLEFTAGDKWQYSDVGYFLLGMIIESASGRKYGEFMTERIFRPLGMTATTIMNQRAIIKHRARGYTLFNGELINIRRDVQIELPSHVGIFSTVLDLAKWDAALYSQKLLKQSSLAQMWTPVSLNNGKTYPYGFGWEVKEQRGHRIVGHTGQTGTEMTRFPDDSLTIIILTNLGSMAIPETQAVNPWGMTTAAARFYLCGLAYQPIPDREPEFTALIKDLHVGRVGSWDETPFAPEYWTELKPALGFITKYLQSLGPLQSMVLVERKQDGENRIYRYRMIYKEKSLIMSVVRNQAGKIVYLSPSSDD